MMDSGIPVASDCMVALVLGDIYDPFIGKELPDYIDGSVRRVVVHYNNIVFEIRFLRQGAADCIANGAYAVLAGDDDGGLEGELPFRQVHGLERRRQVPADGLEMVGHGLLHLDLGAAVARVDIIELFLSRLAEVRLDFIVQELADVLEASFLGDLQPEVVQAGGLVIRGHAGRGAGAL